MDIEHVRHPFLDAVRAAGLPDPDEARPDGDGLAFEWHSTGVIFWAHRDAHEHAPLDEFEAAVIKGMSALDWPTPTAEGYRDYQP